MLPGSENITILSSLMSGKPPHQQPLIGNSEMVGANDDGSSSRQHVVHVDREKEDQALVEQHMSSLKDPQMLAYLKEAINEVAQARAVLEGLGERPDHEAVDLARKNVAQIESRLAKQLEEIVLEKRPDDVDRVEWRARQAEMEKEARKAAEKEKFPYKALINLYEMHESYEELLKNAEKRLAKIYSSTRDYTEELPVKDEVIDEVVRVLQEAAQKNWEKLELKGRMLRFIPEAFGKLTTLVLLDLSNNQLEVIPDSIAGLINLETLNLSSNSLVSLPDSIGLLKRLKVLNVSANKLKALPDDISRCSELTELDASFNKLAYLPTNIGEELVNLQRLDVHLNNLRSLPYSICLMKSLRVLDVHFNELRSLPTAIGQLQNLEVLNASKNFSDLTSIPDTIGDLTNLVELDLSNNQIKELPCSFGRLQNLKKLNLDENPLVIPPLVIVERGVDAVTEYMAKRWVDFLVEEEEKSSLEAISNQAQQNWMQRSGQWLGGVITGVTGSLQGYLGSTEKSHEDDFLNQQL